MDSPLLRVSATLVLAGVVLLATGWVLRLGSLRRGWRGLLVAWAGAALTLTALMAWRIAQQQAALGFSPEQAGASAPVRMFAPMWAVALGAQALVLRRAPTGAPFAALAWRLVLAGFGGMLGYFIVFAMVDFAGLLGARS